MINKFILKFFKIEIIFISLFLFITATNVNAEYKITDPKLVVFIVIDQGAYDTLERVKPFLQNGLKRIINSGVQFKNAFHNHAITYTCPGHATLATGVEPSISGIVSNSWYDKEQKRDIYCVEDKDYKSSPNQLMVPTFGDDLVGSSSRSKVYSVSGKDRAAIMMGGKKALGAYWFDTKKSSFISSEYYSKNKPDWLEKYSKEYFIKDYFSKIWVFNEKNRKKAQQYGFLNVTTPSRSPLFPHLLGGSSTYPTQEFFEDFVNSPYIDEVTENIASDIIKEEHLGKSKVTDILFISFSAVDTVGHKYGPNSLETLDTFIKLDKTIDHLLDTIDTSVGLKNSLVVLSADHGIAPFPEAIKKQFPTAHRETISDATCFQNLNRKLVQDFGKGSWFKSEGVLNIDLLNSYNLSRDTILFRIREELKKCPTVEEVFYTDTNQILPDDNPQSILFSHSYFNGRSPDFFIERKPYNVEILYNGTNHSSCWDYDAHVPLIFSFANLTPKEINQRVDTTDVAPTILHFLDTKCSSCTGIDRSRLILEPRKSSCNF